MAVELSEDARSLLDGRNFATVATLNSDGAPQTSVVWVERDGDAVQFTITSRRQKARNIAHDPRVSVTVVDAQNPYHTVEIRGTAELIEDPKRVLSHRLSWKYADEDPPAEPPEIRRLIVRVTPEKVTGFSV
jgi:PPOX class probable F420-dependent enzyme